MEVFDVLILAAELSMALAGFAGIIATFQYRDAAKIRRADATGLTMIVVYSLLAAFQCGLILILKVVGFTEAQLWTIGSITASIFNIYHFYGFYVSIKGTIRNSQLLTIMWLLQLVAMVILLANVLNAADIVFHREPGPFLVALAFGMCLAGYMFSRLLLVPIWRSVRRQEVKTKAGEEQSGDARQV